MTTRARDTRKAPCRSREEILAGATVVGGRVWVTCWNCGGSGNYPSSLTPPGRCRLYCWTDRTPATYGKLPVEIERYVKKAQASDRREWRLAHPTEKQLAAHAVAIEAARVAEEARLVAEAAKAAKVQEWKQRSRWLAQPGEKVRVLGVIEGTKVINGQWGPHRWVRLRTSNGDVVTCWNWPTFAEHGEVVEIKGTVKSHETYDGEAQTVLLRVKTIVEEEVPA